MKRITLITSIAVAISINLNVNAKSINSESYYVDKYCPYQSEKRNSDNTRTDCYSKEYSIEFDFAKKAYECVGQSLHYAKVNNNTPICALIIESKKDCRYINRIHDVQVVTIDPNSFCGSTSNGYGLTFDNHNKSSISEYENEQDQKPTIIYKDKIVYKDRPKTSNCHYVKGYTRSNGTYVKGYTRCYK